MSSEFFLKVQDPAFSPEARKLLGRMVASQHSIADLAYLSSSQARQQISFKTALHYSVLPLVFEQAAGRRRLVLAAGYSKVEDLQALLKLLSNCECRLIDVDDKILREAIFKAYCSDSEKLRELTNLASVNESAAPSTVGVSEVWNKAEPVIELLRKLIEYAVAVSASDLHIIPNETGALARIRIAGILRENKSALLGHEQVSQACNWLKALAGLDIAVKHLPQDGFLQLPLPHRRVCIRISVLPVIYGEKIVLRFVDQGQCYGLSDLELSPQASSPLKGALSAEHGLILICGPTGSGKTTTLYAMIRELLLSGSNRSIHTIEDPVEQILPGIAQTSLNEKRGLTYANCFRATLRQDPDVILLGELRDSDSARAAIEAAFTGHLILSTLHARYVNEVFLRLGQLGVDQQAALQVMALIVCQRLIPALCRDCRTFDLQGSQEFDCEVFKPIGCSSCNYTGYQGRVLALEVLLVNEQTRAIIKQREQLDVRQPLQAAGYLNSFQDSLLELLKSRSISAAQYKSFN